MTIFIVTYDDGYTGEKYCDAFATRKEAEAYIQNEHICQLDKEWFEIIEKTL